MKKTMTMTNGEMTREVVVEDMIGRPGEYSVYPFCITKVDLENLGFKFYEVMAKAA